MTMHTNILLMTDSYKVSHYRQYPAGTTRVFSFLESRGGQFPQVTFFGLQYIIKRYLTGPVVTEADIVEAREFFTRHFGDATLFNEAGWRHILDVHHGHLPVRISAIPEGMMVPTLNVMMTIENIDPAVPWLTNYLETILCQVWYPTTVCTQSRAMRQMIIEALEVSGDPTGVNFKLHDFGFRGSTSIESAGIGGAAHLVNFQGTDTMAALIVARDFYGEPMAGFSIPAAEHSTITSWGRDNEVKAYANMLTSFPTGLVAVVSDSYDIFNACERLWGGELRDQVLHRDGVLVVRPDSGDPPTVVVKVLELLGQAFGTTINAKGYRVLNPKVRVIQGDGIDFAMLQKILAVLLSQGWSADNIAFGSGGGLLQKMDRDTCRFAFKCSAIEINGVWHNVSKDPVTDHAKKSKAGRLMLITHGATVTTVVEGATKAENLLRPVFENGQLLINQTLTEIRNRVQ